MPLLKTLDRASSNAIEATEDYVEVTKRYYRLKLFQQLASYFASISKLALLGGIIFMAVILLSVAGALALGNALGSFSLGCVLMAAILLLVAMIIYLGRVALIDRVVLRSMATTFFDDSDDPDETV